MHGRPVVANAGLAEYKQCITAGMSIDATAPHFVGPITSSTVSSIPNSQP